MKSPAPSRPQKMALIPACIFLCFAALSVQAEETPVTPQPPDILLGPLFNDVQNAKLFPDQKTFADAVPNSDPLMILADYRMQQNQSGFDLRHFVNVNFTLPKEGEKYVPPEGQSLRVLPKTPKNGILCYRCRNLMSCRADAFARYITGTVTSPC